MANEYDIPMVSMKSSILPEIEEGRLDATQISEDMLHPNDIGHRMIADVIIALLERIYDSIDTVEEGDTSLPLPITPNRYENAFLINQNNKDEYKMLS